MPIYEYACEKCGKVVEQIQKATDAGPKKCEHCGGRMSRVMSRSSFQLKGGGWYKDLYSSTPEPSKKDGGTFESKGESKGEAKGESKSDSKASATEGKGSASGGSAEKKPAAEAKSSESKSPPKESKPTAKASSGLSSGLSSKGKK